MMSTSGGAVLVEANRTPFHVDPAGHGTQVLILPGTGGEARQYFKPAQLPARARAVIA
ncbi:hypothetical protein [Arthrobacter sp. PAMC25284]|uniref:hypothetical protein n=1 Tax=Arthrobacter sp. PAMC25284 TaxID=2861279 RepID=UPI001C631F7B|nr:hypothetical protein [Arthrobacter sp. PAMC25284]QYF90690.1 hypothetical protein KY499_05310 [Arthrobacter sp. PAMC25284]